MAKTTRKRGKRVLPPPPDPTTLVMELVSLVREVSAQQNKVLSSALEAQAAQAAMLQTWIGLFTPTTAPQRSTTEQEREQIRLDLEAAEWEPLTALGIPTDGEWA